MNAQNNTTTTDPGAHVDRIALVVVKVLGVLALLGILAYAWLLYALRDLRIVG